MTGRSIPESGAQPLCVCLTGPTASGKTRLALALAEEFPAEIVSMDSAMVYRGMDIGTDKPDVATRERVPHHLVDIVEPEEAYSAGRFAADAASAIRAIRSRGKLAIVAGGTLLYLRALREGLADLPERDAAVREAIDREAGEIGWPAMHAQLAAVDPEAAAKIDVADRQRIQRALEVFRVAGRPLSQLQRASNDRQRFDLVTYALVPPDRAELRARIEARFDEMVERGLIEEVRALRERPALTASASSMRAVGYRQIWAYLEHRCTWAAARERAITATRQLAKRQMTWLRGDEDTERLAAGGSRTREELFGRVHRLMAAWGRD